jgi:DNA-binding NtrC family response regulator
VATRTLGTPPSQLVHDRRTERRRDLFAERPLVCRRLGAKVRAFIVCEGAAIGAEHLSLANRAVAPSAGRTTDLGALEQQAIAQAMREVAGNKMMAAKKLGISRMQLYTRLRKYGFEGH